MRLKPAARSRHGKQHPDRQCRPRRGRTASGLAALAALAALAFLVGGCGSGATSSSPATTGAGAAGGTGVVTRSGSGGQSGNLTSGGNLTGGQASRYSVAFAECMRAHGVPRFPDPNASLPALGSGSGVDPSSPAYQAALHGPCKSLAPAGWTSSGLVTQGGRS
jgi:hypothetical protein